MSHVPKTLRYIADAIEALENAYRATEDGFTSDHLNNAEVECYKALNCLVRSQHHFAEHINGVEQTQGVAEENVE
jgi:hypothetical protein